jgi:predicted XRE-type DNA-binding protein
LTIKSDLCNQILKLVRELGYTQKDLAKIWSKPQPRVSEVLNCKISLFSIDTLVTYLGQLGADVTVKVARDGKAAS